MMLLLALYLYPLFINTRTVERLIRLKRLIHLSVSSVILLIKSSGGALFKLFLSVCSNISLTFQQYFYLQHMHFYHIFADISKHISRNVSFNALL